MIFQKDSTKEQQDLSRLPSEPTSDPDKFDWPWKRIDKRAPPIDFDSESD
jgi:hypothetical protein